MSVVDVRFTLDGPEARPPLRAYDSDAGCDLPTKEEMVIPAGKAVNLPTGIAMEIPAGFWAMIVGRSSAHSLMGLVVIPGIIDGGYRGELFVRTWNPTAKPITVLQYQRIGQVIFFPLVVARFTQAASLGPGDRGDKGFGSTG